MARNRRGGFVADSHTNAGLEMVFPMTLGTRNMVRLAFTQVHSHCVVREDESFSLDNTRNIESAGVHAAQLTLRVLLAYSIPEARKMVNPIPRVDEDPKSHSAI